MDYKEHTTPGALEKYSFWWSEARLVIAGLALLIGGTPPLFLIMPAAWGFTMPLLKICWIISGLVALYLAYRWFTNGQRVFGGKEMKDMVAFAITVLTGINLGLTGLTANNLGMSIVGGGRAIFFVTGLIYFVTAWYMYKRWNESRQSMF